MDELIEAFSNILVMYDKETNAVYLEDNDDLFPNIVEICNILVKNGVRIFFGPDKYMEFVAGVNVNYIKHYDNGSVFYRTIVEEIYE